MGTQVDEHLGVSFDQAFMAAAGGEGGEAAPMEATTPGRHIDSTSAALRRVMFCDFVGQAAEQKYQEVSTRCRCCCR